MPLVLISCSYWISHSDNTDHRRGIRPSASFVTLYMRVKAAVCLLYSPYLRPIHLGLLYTSQSRPDSGCKEMRSKLTRFKFARDPAISGSYHHRYSRPQGSDRLSEARRLNRFLRIGKLHLLRSLRIRISHLALINARMNGDLRTSKWQSERIQGM